MRNTYQIIVLGPGGAGKTKGLNTLLSILSQLGFQTSEVKPWTEAMVTTSSYVIHNFTVPMNYFDNEKPIKTVVLDMGGQFKYKEMWRMHAEDTDAIVAVVDMTRKTTLKQIPLMLPKGLMEDVPVRLIVNKADLYTDFAAKTEAIANQVYAAFQQVMTSGVVDYVVQYKGEEKFVFNSKVYRYGDSVPVMRQLVQDQFGNIAARMADFEVVAAKAFKQALPDITIHNAYLFGREFSLLVFDVLYSNESNNMLSDELIENAHNEAPPFLSWGTDPDVLVPVEELSPNVILKTVSAMLIDENDLWAMVERLQQMGYNIDVGDERSWALTSAMLFEENPNVNYKPMHKAVLPPYFIRKMVDYSNQKQDDEEDFFV